jgi:molybdate transport system ATP-binding protein
VVTLELAVVDEERGVDVALTVQGGETVALLGPNGAGKTTLLETVAGLLVPDHGLVVLNGRPLTRAGRDAAQGGRVLVPPHARRTALLGQEALLFPHLSVLDNVAFGPRSGGGSRRDAQAVAERWLDEVGAGDLRDRKPRQLSGGQAQRVAVARALAAAPEVLLLDEPLAAVDVALAPTLRQMLRRVLAGRTAVVVTHDPLDALLVADRTVVMEEGSVVEDGPSSEVLSRPRSAFAARLAGLNLVMGSWRDGQVVTTAGGAVQGLVDGEPPAPGEDVVAAFRPSSVAVYRQPPQGSPRNVFGVTVTQLEPLGDVVRVRADGLSADVTVQAAAELELMAGQHVAFTVKATEVAVYRV